MWILFVIGCMVLFAGLYVYSKKDAVDVSKVDTTKVQKASEESGAIGDHTYGNPNAKVVIVEYGDFQCPGCGNLHPAVKTASEKYKDDALFIFRNFPLTQIHPNAKAAAAAAEAAGLSGKYWEMHNLLYERQSDWSSASTDTRTSIFAQYAKELGINQETFTKTLTEKNDAINKKINFDRALGVQAKVEATPTLFVNGRKVEQKEIDGKDGVDKLFSNAIAASKK
jgi:protein-disulfide isomerase